ncbi:MAG: Arc family DNA-binding protein [Pseudomonadota bacterium]|nr:Arc family DNA-binding protein [Pseudomonadota bacterium]
MNATKQPNSFPLRMPEDLRARIEARAAATNRSSNAEIVVMLTAMLDAESSLGAVSVETLLKAVADRMGAAVQIVVTPDASKVADIKQSAAPKKRKA